MTQHAAVTGNFTATGQSASFRPSVDDDTTSRLFAAGISGTFVGNAQLECQYDGTNWLPVYIATATAFTAPTGLVNVTAPIQGAAYRWNCTAFTSGTISYVMAQ